MPSTDIFQQQTRGDFCGFEDDGQSAAGVGAAADEVSVFQFVETVGRAKVQHLPKVVRQVEGGAAIDFEFVLPVGRCAKPFSFAFFSDGESSSTPAAKCSGCHNQ